jgi:hypothetical protein
MSSIIIDNAGLLSHQDIHEIFDGNRLGSVVQVTILPEYDPVSKQTINKAYVLIDEWYDTESAFNFIKETQTPRGSLMHCNNNAFCVVKRAAPTAYHNNNFRSKWTQRFQNLAKQEFILALKELAEEEYKMELLVLEALAEEVEEVEEVLSDEALKNVFPLTYDGLMQWHKNDRKEKEIKKKEDEDEEKEKEKEKEKEQRKNTDELNQFFIEFFKMDRK